MRQKYLLLVVLAVQAAALPRPAAAEEWNGQTLMRFASRNVATFLGNYGEKQVAVEFRVPPAMKGAGENALLQMLAEQLTPRGIRLVSRAKFTVQIDCQTRSVRSPEHDTAADEWPVADQAPAADQRLELRVTLRMIDALGEVVLDPVMAGTLTDQAELVRLFGVSGRLGGSGGLSGAVRQPRVSILDDSRARASADGKLSVGVRVKDSPRRLTVRGGYCFAPLDADEEYAITLHNDSDREVLAAVNVDGLSVFHFSTSRVKEGPRKGMPRYRYYVLAPGKTTTVSGWHKGGGEDGKHQVLSFKVTPLAESASAKLGKSDRAGVISVEFRSCKIAEKSEPRVQMQDTRTQMIGRTVRVKDANGKTHDLEVLVAQTQSMTIEGTRVGTGFGTERTVGLKGVSRWIGPIEEVVSIHYERP